MTLAQMRKLVRQSEKAAKIVERNRSLMETYLSIQEYKAGKVKEYPSVDAIFRAAKRLRVR